MVGLNGVLNCIANSWTPQIGDPNLAGWLTFAAYMVCAVLALAVWRRQPRGGGRRFWAALAVLMLFLGMNKQLDLQTALIEAGRCLAHVQGWYAQRRLVQLAFIALLLAIVLASLLWGRRALRGRLANNRLALLGMAILAAFVLVRAIGFQHLDALIGNRQFSDGTNYVFENTGLLLIALNAVAILRRRGRRKRSGAARA